MAPASEQTLERGLGDPKGQEILARGLPWVFGLSPEALKHSTRCRLLMPGGRPLARRPKYNARDPVAHLGQFTLERIAQGKTHKR
jgi:hypothetical protein